MHDRVDEHGLRMVGGCMCGMRVSGVLKLGLRPPWSGGPRRPRAPPLWGADELRAQAWVEVAVERWSSLTVTWRADVWSVDML
eukprot:355087-Chlamydomonas_euryale.AAC.3